MTVNMVQSMNRKHIFLCFTLPLIFLLLLNTVFSQENQFSHIQDLYRQFKFREVVRQCQQQLNNRPDLTRDQQLFLNKYLALSYSHLGDTSEVKITLQQLLTLEPAFRFSFAEASPKLIALLEKVRKERKLRIREQVGKWEMPGEEKILGKYAAVKSLLIPGWGQYVQGKKKRSILFFTTAAGGVAGWIYFHQKMVEAHRDYLNADEYSGVEDKYQRYKNFYRLRNTFIGLTIVSWISSHIDAALFPPEHPGENWVALYFRGHSAGIRFHF